MSASYPGASLPMRSARRSTWAALTVTAPSASDGESPSCVHASEHTSGSDSQNALPGLKSVASAIAPPAPTSSLRAGHRSPENQRGHRKDHADRVARRELPEAFFARRLEVVDRAGAELDRERDRPLLGELVTVHAKC